MNVVGEIVKEVGPERATETVGIDA